MVGFASFKIMSIFLYAQGPFDFLLFFVCPCICAAFGILVPRPGIETVPLSVKMLITGLPENSLILFQVVQGTESPCQSRRPRRQVRYLWVRKIPWMRKWQPTPAFLPGKSPRQRNLAGKGPWITKSQTWLSTHAQDGHEPSVYIS